MKVTFLTGEYPPMQGGIADHIAYLAQYLTPLAVEPSILISRRWQDTEPEADDLSINAPAQVHSVLPNWGWRCWPGIVNFLKAYQPNVLHIQYQAAAFDLGGWVNWLPWYLKKRRVKTRLVTTFHDLRVPYIFPKAGPFRWRSMLALARHSDGVICTNREDLHTLQHTLNVGQTVSLTGAKGQANSSTDTKPLLTLIPLGSNVEPQPPAGFDRTAWRKKYRATTDTLLLAYFGFLNESKGGEELIDALALLRQRGIDAHLLLIGGDVGHADPTNIAYARKVQALIERHHLADVVHRTGYVELPEVSANLLAADVVVMPYRDGVSFRRTTLIAALRHGCPVVSTTPVDQTLIPEIRQGKNMLLGQPRNAAALAEIIAPLAQDMALRQKLSQGAKQLGGLFDWDKIAGGTADLYQSLNN
jgi:glycosyltransferase involved in cell wall biosynthesis